MVFEASVVVAEFDLMRVAAHETEADAPLIVHGDGILAETIPFQRVKAVTPRLTNVSDALGAVDEIQPFDRTSQHVRRNPGSIVPAEQLRCPHVAKAPDHGMYCVT